MLFRAIKMSCVHIENQDERFKCLAVAVQIIPSVLL